MYDTVKMCLPRYSTDDWGRVSQAIEDARGKADTETGEITTIGHHRNLRITQSESGLYLCGSIAKWYLPYEPITLNRNQTKEAIEALCDIFHIDMNRAIVRRLDGSKDFIMEYPAQRYYELLAAMPRHSRVMATENTLYFTHAASKSLNTLCFYDKRREVEARHGDVPIVYQGTNLLRYELRLTGRIRLQMKWGEDVTASTLYNRRFYGAFVRLWAGAYNSIEKRCTVDISNFPADLRAADIVNILCAYGLQRITPDEENSIMLALAGKVKDRHYIARAREKIKDIRQRAKISDTDILVRELDANIRNVMIYGQ